MSLTACSCRVLVPPPSPFPSAWRHRSHHLLLVLAESLSHLPAHSPQHGNTKVITYCLFLPSPCPTSHPIPLSMATPKSSLTACSCRVLVPPPSPFPSAWQHQSHHLLLVLAQSLSHLPTHSPQHGNTEVITYCLFLPSPCPTSQPIPLSMATPKSSLTACSCRVLVPPPNPFPSAWQHQSHHLLLVLAQSLSHLPAHSPQHGNTEVITYCLFLPSPCPTSQPIPLSMATPKSSLTACSCRVLVPPPSPFPSAWQHRSHQRVRCRNLPGRAEKQSTRREN